MSQALVFEVPDHQRARVDYLASRCVVIGRYLRFAVQDQEMEVETAILDTGSEFGPVAPRSALHDGLGADWADRIEVFGGQVTGFGGRIHTDCFFADLTLGNWRIEACEVHTPRAGAVDVPHWLVGLPILRHFNLLLRTAHGGPWLAGPDPLCPLPGQWLPAR